MEVSSPSKKVALFDICGTLVGVTTIVDFTERYLLSPKHNRKFDMFAWLAHAAVRIGRRFRIVSPSWHRAHLMRLYRGLTEEDLESLAEIYAKDLMTHLKGPIADEFKRLKENNHDMYIVSAGLDAYLKPFARALGATLVATTLERNKEGRYTGRIEGVDCAGEGKVELLRKTLHVEEVDWHESYAFGDSQADIPLLLLVGNGSVVDPDPFLAEEANKHGWRVVTSV